MVLKSALNLTPVVNWFKREYPCPALNPTWLAQAAEELAGHNSGYTTQTLIKALESQLLDSHLQITCLPEPPALPASTASEDQLPSDVIPSGSVLFGPERSQAVLVMILSIMEIGHSAFHLQNVMDQRREALSGATRIRGIAELGPHGDGTGEDGSDQEEEAPGADGDLPVYPRSMLMLEVSDGWKIMKAIEMKRIPALKLGETPLGSKLLLRNVKAQRGILQLTPENTTFKGGCVVEMEEQQGRLFKTALRTRMGLDPLEEEVEETRSEAANIAQQEQPLIPNVDSRSRRDTSQRRQRPSANTAMREPAVADQGREDQSDYSDFPIEEVDLGIGPSSARDGGKRGPKDLDDSFAMYGGPDDDEIEALMAAQMEPDFEVEPERSSKRQRSSKVKASADEILDIPSPPQNQPSTSRFFSDVEPRPKASQPPQRKIRGDGPGNSGGHPALRAIPSAARAPDVSAFDSDDFIYVTDNEQDVGEDEDSEKENRRPPGSCVIEIDDSD